MCHHWPEEFCKGAQFLGFQVDARQMKFSLPEGKIQDIAQVCQGILAQGRLSIRQLSRLLGKLNAVSQAVLSAPIRYRQLQQLKIQSLKRSRSFDTLVTLDQRAVEELLWWKDQLRNWNGRDIVPPPPDMVIETDASNIGWGAVCRGVRTGGPWSQQEQAQHINVLELTAASLAVKTFARDNPKDQMHIHLRMDNVSALTYVSRMGGTRSPELMRVACSLWDWCLQRGITLSASHLPGVNNLIADQESREVRTSAEWRLDKDLFLRVCNILGPCNVDLFASRLNYQLPQYISWRPDPGAMSTDAFQSNWTNLKGYAFPPFALIGRCLQKIRVEQSTVVLIAPTWQNQIWYPECIIGNADRSSNPPPLVQGYADKPREPATPTGNSKQTKASRLEDIRQQHTLAGISSEASELLLAGWSRGTNVAYQSGWKRWSSWCKGRKINPISAGIQPFLNFITSLFQEGLQYRTINTIRSAVSSTHNPIDGIPVGQHPLVKQLLKGVYNSRPPQPRYTHTWEVSRVLEHIKRLGENKEISLKTLSFKLVVLMALIRASRVSELQALDLRFRYYKPDGVLFRLASLTKKRHLGAALKECFFASFPEDSRLCVVHCLKQYETLTEGYRRVDPGKPAPLFVSYVKPHKPVTSQRLAHWVKDLLKEAGVDTGIFKAHSTRGASTSAALTKGLHIKDILDTADWSCESTFKKFYYRSSQDNSFATKILSSEESAPHC